MNMTLLAATISYFLARGESNGYILYERGGNGPKFRCCGETKEQSWSSLEATRIDKSGRKESNLKTRVMQVLDSIRGSLQADGGDVELVEVIEEQGVVRLKLTGACGSCPMSQMTLQMGLERILKQQVPEVKQVVAVQDATE